MAKEIDIYNALVTKLYGLEAPIVEYTPVSGEDSRRLRSESVATIAPSAVLAFPAEQVFEAGRNCGTVARRARWTWRVMVDFQRVVDTQVWADTVAQQGIQFPTDEGPQIARLLTLESIPRPSEDPEAGTHLTLTFQVITR